MGYSKQTRHLPHLKPVIAGGVRELQYNVISKGTVPLRA
jgi:hypothetical protein